MSEMRAAVYVGGTGAVLPGFSVMRLAVSARFAALDLVRNRTAVVLLLVIPLILFALIHVTTGEREIAFELSAAPGLRSGSERELSILFIALTAISGLSAFLAFMLVLRPIGTDRRLVFEGYRPAELLLAKLAVLAGIALVVAGWVTALLPIFGRLPLSPGIFAGFLLASLIYGAIGLALGAVARREIDGMLAILLLINIDAGWLQNPVFYAHAHQQQLIRLLPAHQPGQLAMLSAFSDEAVIRPLLLSTAVLLVLCTAGALLYRRRVRVAR
jgi:hypothetical protein